MTSVSIIFYKLKLLHNSWLGALGISWSHQNSQMWSLRDQINRKKVDQSEKPRSTPPDYAGVFEHVSGESDIRTTRDLKVVH